MSITSAALRKKVAAKLQIISNSNFPFDVWFSLIASLFGGYKTSQNQYMLWNKQQSGVSCPHMECVTQSRPFCYGLLIWSHSSLCFSFAAAANFFASSHEKKIYSKRVRNRCCFFNLISIRKIVGCQLHLQEKLLPDLAIQCIVNKKKI